METICNRIQEQKNLKICQKKELKKKLNTIEQQLIRITDQMKMKIQQMVDAVKDEVNLLYILCMLIKYLGKYLYFVLFLGI